MKNFTIGAAITAACFFAAPVTALDIGVDVGASVGGGGVGADVGANVGGIDAGATASVGKSGVDADVNANIGSTTAGVGVGVATTPGVVGANVNAALTIDPSDWVGRRVVTSDRVVIGTVQSVRNGSRTNCPSLGVQTANSFSATAERVWLDMASCTPGASGPIQVSMKADRLRRALN